MATNQAKPYLVVIALLTGATALLHFSGSEAIWPADGAKAVDRPPAASRPQASRVPAADESAHAAPDAQESTSPESRAATRERMAAYKLRRKDQRSALENKIQAAIGESFISGHEKFASLDTFRAVRTREGESTPQTTVRRLGPWSITESAEARTSSPKSRLTRFDPDSPPVVFNRESERLGIVTGEIAVHYREGAVPNQLAREGLDFVSASEGTHWAFFQARADQDLLALQDSLKAQEGVEEVVLDVQYDRAQAPRGGTAR